MSFNKSFVKSRILPLMYSAAIFAATASPIFAAEEEEAAPSGPVWVMSWFAFIVFGGATIGICVFFSRRQESILTQEDQKRVAKIRADKITQRRKEERIARMQASKKKK
ncbi:MAG: hypothetical protein HUK22_07835 [Thermoguttaceae bacterium]|nr:hypothetical protein [Thermoguttaceae bacterium]